MVQIITVGKYFRSFVLGKFEDLERNFHLPNNAIHKLQWYLFMLPRNHFLSKGVTNQLLFFFKYMMALRNPRLLCIKGNKLCIRHQGPVRLRHACIDQSVPLVCSHQSVNESAQNPTINRAGVLICFEMCASKQKSNCQTNRKVTIRC